MFNFNDIINEPISKAVSPLRRTVSEFADVLRGKYLPFKSLLFAPENEPDSAIFKIAEFAKDYRTLDGKNTLYVCRKHVCGKPVTEIEEAVKMIG